MEVQHTLREEERTEEVETTLGGSKCLGVTTCKGSVSLQEAKKRGVPRMLQMPLESVLTTGCHL